MYKKLLTSIFSFFIFCANLWSQEIYRLSDKTLIKIEELCHEMNSTDLIVLGEEHYEQSVQWAEKSIIDKCLTYWRANDISTSRPNLAWEFLDYPNQKEIEKVFKDYHQRKLDIDQLMAKLFPTSAQKHFIYGPLFEAIDRHHGKVIATNAPREWKKIITTQGLEALRARNPKMIPDNMRLGSDNYWSRFTLAMQDHVPPQSLKNYYQAQCYTDAVIADQIYKAAGDGKEQISKTFLVIGSFHSDYLDGVVSQLNDFFYHNKTIKIVSKKGLSQEELEKLLTPHAQFGIIADYLYLAE